MAPSPSAADALARAINLRDLGGHAVAGGGRVARGRAYRSAVPAALDAATLAAARALGLRTIVDLRHNAEREAHPSAWQALGGTDYWCRDHHDSGADLGRRLRVPGITAADARAAMLDLYAALPFAQAEGYARLLGALADGAHPVLFHCAVGKDRTGVGAALLLAALGVPRAAIEDDYARTAAFDLLGSAPFRGRPPPPPGRQAILAPLLGTDRAYLDAAFAAVAAAGGIERYLADTLGMSAAARAALREAMIER